MQKRAMPKKRRCKMSPFKNLTKNLTKRHHLKNRMLPKD
jgi:hypothetical protein